MVEAAFLGLMFLAAGAVAVLLYLREKGWGRKG